MGDPNRLTKPESASGPVEVGKSTIQVKYTLVRGEKSNEIVSEYFGGLRASIRNKIIRTL
jgi:hypothetical protein